MKRKRYSAIFCMILIALFCNGCKKADIGAKDEGDAPTKETLALVYIGTMGQEILDDAVEEFNRTNGCWVEIECEYYGDEEYKKELASILPIMQCSLRLWH